MFFDFFFYVAERAAVPVAALEAGADFAALALRGAGAGAAAAAAALGTGVGAAAFLPKPRRCPRTGAAASNSRHSSSVSDFGSRSFGIFAFFCMSVMYGP